jgi:large subunit ribosomal protein L23
MALFDIFKKRKERERFDKKQKEKEDKTEIKKPEALTKKASVFAGKIIIKPHVAEKSTLLKEKGVYLFKVSSQANKIMVKRAIRETYGIVPRKINIVNIPSKKIFIRRRQGTKPGFKKAIVFLKKGDKIETL